MTCSHTGFVLSVNICLYIFRIDCQSNGRYYGCYHGCYSCLCYRFCKDICFCNRGNLICNGGTLVCNEVEGELGLVVVEEVLGHMLVVVLGHS